MFSLRRKSPVRKVFCKANARILWLVHYIVSDGLHQTVHKLQAGRAQNLNYLIPLVDIWTESLLGKNPAGLYTNIQAHEKSKARITVLLGFALFKNSKSKGL